MTDNPRSILLQRARRRTAAIVIGALAGTGLLTVGIAATAPAGHRPRQRRDDAATPRRGTNVRQRAVGRLVRQLDRHRERRRRAHALGRLRRREPLVMSVTTTWRDWSCRVRVTLADRRRTDLAAATSARPAA